MDILINLGIEIPKLLFIDWQPSIEVFALGPLVIRWYALLWAVGLLLGYAVEMRIYKQQGIASKVSDPLLFYCFIGVLIGARLGHCIFYQPEYFLTSVKGLVEMILPIRLFADGSFEIHGYEGLASHGGTIGLFFALMYFWRKNHLRPLMVLDNVAVAVPITACCIRLGNLMNSEIVGQPTDVPWAFIFHSYDSLVDGLPVPRHPAQLYEAIAYFTIFIITILIYRYWYNKQKMSDLSPVSIGSGFYFGFCLAMIFTFRFFVEFIKKEQVDFERDMPLDMGQLLSIPFVIIGLIFIVRAIWRSRRSQVA